MIWVAGIQIYVCIHVCTNIHVQYMNVSTNMYIHLVCESFISGVCVCCIPGAARVSSICSMPGVLCWGTCIPGVNVYVYVFICVPTYSCVYTYMYGHIHIYRYTYIYTYIHMQLHMNLHIHLYVFIYKYIHIYICIYVHTYMYIHVYLYIYI